MPVHSQARLWIGLAVCLSGIGALLGGCVSHSPRVIKIGLVAPFEGQYREIGSEVVPAIRYALRQFADSGQPIILELVAYDDEGNEALARAQAKALVRDAEVAAVIGHWRDATTRAAVPIYEAAGVPLITFSSDDFDTSRVVLNLAPRQQHLKSAALAWSADVDGQPLSLAAESGNLGISTLVFRDSHRFQPDTNHSPLTMDWGLIKPNALGLAANPPIYFVTGYAYAEDVESQRAKANTLLAFDKGFRDGSLGAPSGILSFAAYEAGWVGIREALHHNNIDFNITVGPIIGFDDTGRRMAPPIYVYQLHAARNLLVARLH